MRLLTIAMVVLAIAIPVTGQAQSSEAAVRATVQTFYAAFNSHGFDRAADFTTEDWNHINPYGGRTHGRAAVLKELHEVHGSFLNGVSDSIEQMDARFASTDVAVVTVTSRMSSFTSPDGMKHENERHIRTFVVAKRGARWLIMQDQNTVVMPPPNAR